MANQDQKNRPLLNRDRLNRLLKQEWPTDQPRISIYLPLHPSGADAEGDAIVYKNLVTEAERELDKRFPRRAWEATIKRLRALPEEEALFVQRYYRGMVVLASGDELAVFTLMNPVEAAVFVSKTFHILSLLAFFEEFDDVIMAELGRDRVRLYAANRYSVEPYRAPDIITNFDELFDDFDNDSNLNFGSYGGQGGQSGMFHGHRTSTDESDKDRDKYFKYLDEGFTQLHRHEKRPIILAGTAATIANFRKLAKGRFYLDHAIEKPLDTLEQGEMTEAIRKAMNPIYQEALNEVQSRLRRAESDQRTEKRITHIRDRVVEGAIAEIVINHSRIKHDDTSLDQIILNAYATGTRLTILPEGMEDLTSPYVAILRY